MASFLPYFSFKGRTNRRRYWEIALTIFVLFFLAAFIGVALSELPVLGIIGGLLLLAVGLSAVVAALANGARRLHDREMSAWWLLLFAGLPTLLSLFGDLLKASDDTGAAAAGAAFGLLGLPFSIWGFVVMGCLKGTVGPNRYGDDPLQPSTQEVFA